jgi:hypothetical protein
LTSEFPANECQLTRIRKGKRATTDFTDGTDKEREMCAAKGRKVCKNRKKRSARETELAKKRKLGDETSAEQGQ